MEQAKQIVSFKDIILIGIIVLLAYFLYLGRQEVQEIKDLNTTLSEELVVSRNKLGQQLSTINALETRNVKQFLALTSQDKAVKDLQKEVKEMRKYLKNSGSVTNFSTSLNLQDFGLTTNVSYKDNSEFPTYSSNFNLDNWVKGSIVASKDTTKVSLSVSNQYFVTVGEEPQGFLGLGKSKTFVRVKNMNPYTETTELKTYNVTTPKPKKFGIGPFLGVTLGNNLSIQPTIGVGIQYTLIKF